MRSNSENCEDQYNPQTSLKLFPNENTYQSNNQTNKKREQKLRREVAVIGEL